MTPSDPARLGTIMADIRRRLGDAGIDTADLDARLLLQMALGTGRIAIALDRDRVIPPDRLDRLEGLVRRRLAHEPISRIAGRREFWSLEFALAPETLDPRPDTETVVEAALLAARTTDADPLHVVDLGTGTGAILLAVLAELPGATGIGVDRAPGAVETARANAEALGLGSRARFLVGDWSSGLAERSVDLIVSNPPYIPSGDIEGLSAEVRLFDPRAALDGGPDGLDAYRAIVADAPRVLRSGGALVLELGLGQAQAVSTLVADARLDTVGILSDLAGIPRALTARLRP